MKNHILIPIENHCVNIVDVLSEGEYLICWENVAEWLLIASSVKSVDLDMVSYDISFGYCSGADEFVLSREKLLIDFVRRLSIFNFVWGALESSIDIVSCSKYAGKFVRGKIHNTCHYLTDKFMYRPSVLFLEDVISDFRLTAQDCMGFGRVEARFREAGRIGLPGIGLYAVYELRNSFAHGGLAFPMPDEENKPVSEHSNMVEYATRIVLIAIQMLLLAYFDESDHMVGYRCSYSGEMGDFPVWFALRQCHLDVEENDNQLPLFELD